MNVKIYVETTQVITHKLTAHNATSLKLNPFFYFDWSSFK